MKKQKTIFIRCFLKSNSLISLLIKIYWIIQLINKIRDFYIKILVIHKTVKGKFKELNLLKKKIFMLRIKETSISKVSILSVFSY